MAITLNYNHAKRVQAGPSTSKEAGQAKGSDDAGAKHTDASQRSNRWKSMAYKTMLGRRIEIDDFPGGCGKFFPASIDTESLSPSWNVGVIFDEDQGRPGDDPDERIYSELDLLHNKQISYRWLLDPLYSSAAKFKGPKPKLEVGTTIEVLYDNPEEFFAAKILSFNKQTGKATLKYNDGVEEEVNLKDSDLKYRILKSDEILERDWSENWKALALEATLGRRIEVEYDGHYFAATVDAKSLRPKSWSVRVTYDKHKHASGPPSDELLDLLHDTSIEYRWLLDPLYSSAAKFKGSKPKLVVGTTIEVLYDNPEEFFAAKILSFNKQTGKATLKYNDGVEEEVNLKDSDLKYRILKSDEILERNWRENWKALALEATLGRRIEVEYDGHYFAATVDAKSLRPKSWSVRVTYDKHKHASGPPSNEVLDLLHDTSIEYRWLLGPLNVGSRVEVLYDAPERFFAAQISQINKETGKATLKYDDGDITKVNLKDSDVKYRILERDIRLQLLPNSGLNKAQRPRVTKSTGEVRKAKVNGTGRSRFDQAGFQKLLNEFNKNSSPSMARREELAREFNVPTEVVSNWFKRKRSSTKDKGEKRAHASTSKLEREREIAKSALIALENNSMSRRNKDKRKRSSLEIDRAERESPAEVCVAAIQMSCTASYKNNLSKAISLIRKARKEGAHIVLLQELFTETYFPQVLDDSHFDKAQDYESSPLLARMSALAKELDIVIPVSFFEVHNNAYFNSVCVIDANGERLGRYRKAHIPMSPGYEEKFYFSPGNTDFRVFDTKYAKIGVGICWDQWFPEVSRILALKGAELLFYPTAIGTEPQDAKLDSKEHWRRVIQGQAGANILPIVTSNRTGTEKFVHYNGAATKIHFYGNSFICGPKGEIVACADKEQDEKILVATFDLEEIERQRRSWGLFRDRRPDLYEPLLTLDGQLKL